MRNFKNIFVLLDRKIGDEATLDRAVEMARDNKARLTLAEVVEHVPERSNTLGFIDERAAHLERLVGGLRSTGIEVDEVVLQGPTFIAIIRHVLREGIDLVMITADGRGGLRDLFFGSNSLHLIRKAPCPVWVMKPVKHEPYKRIMAALDLAVGDPEHEGLNRRILELGVSLARNDGSELVITHAWDLEGADLEHSRMELPYGELEKLLEENETRHSTRLDELLEGIDLGQVRLEPHLERGDPGVVIPLLAETQKVDCIVMGTVCRTGISGFFIGNTAETILQQVACSVLTLKPKGFVSPVTLTG
ncbi:MAG: universal stress protein [Rhodospirillales bacterium]|nr:universal stress protein [Alphaproteobacteria bacterium]MBL6948729.1 universal stress protein [Rhodospirillales bacterium]